MGGMDRKLVDNGYENQTGNQASVADLDTH